MSMNQVRKQKKSMEVARESFGVIGLGYVGLPLLVEIAKSGFLAVGFDVDPRKIESIATGESYIEDVDSSELAKLVTGGVLRATTDFSELARMRAISICVPTPLSKTKDPDISYILKAAKAVSENLCKGQTVILESTTYPGTTDEVVLPELESTGMRVGEDFHLAFSPERVDPANPKWKTKNTPKVIGGVTPQCTKFAMKYYGSIFETMVPVSSTRCAEMVKLLENTFRSVNIGLVNEMALMCDKLGLDVWEVIDAAATKPFGFMPFLPGPGLGGHCIPIDPHYLSWKLKTLNYHARFIEMAAEINGAMPTYVVQRVVDALNDDMKSVKGSKILVLGVAYKKDVSDVRESPALDIMGLLKSRGAQVEYHDPYVHMIDEHGLEMKSVKLSAAKLKAVDCVVIVTNHSNFDIAFIGANTRVIVDTRNTMKAVAAKAKARIVKL